MQGSHVQFVHLQLGFEQFGSISLIRKSNIKRYIAQSVIFFKLKRTTLLIGIISLVLGILAYQSAMDQIDEIMEIIRESQAGRGARYTREELQLMNDNAEVTLMFARGFLGFSAAMILYAFYDDISRIVAKMKN